MEGDLTSKQQQAGDLVKDFKAVEDQVGKVRVCGGVVGAKLWGCVGLGVAVECVWPV